MIASGQIQGERYSLTAHRTGDICLKVRGERGEMLARALRGRLARSSGAWYLTPARAQKWRLLFLGGYSARRCMINGITGWGFAHGDGRPMSLAVALWQARLALG